MEELQMENISTNTSLNSSEKISLGEKLIFGAGGFAGNLLIMSVNMYLMFFYTDVFKISAVAAGTLFLVARVVDSIVDFSMGYLIDRTKSKWGKFRPYVMFGCIPFCVLTVLCFTVPNFNEPQKVVYAYVTYLLVMIATTVATLPCQAILPALTQEPTERIKLNNFSSFFGMVGMMIVAVGTIPIVMTLGKGDMAKGFFITMVIFSSIAAIIFILWTLKIREKIVVEKHAELRLKEALPMVFKNKYLLLLAATFVLFMSGFTIRNNSQMYYLMYSLQRPDLIPVVGLLSMLPLVLTILSVPFVVGKLGKKNTLMMGIIIQIVANVCQYFVGLDNLTMIFVFTVMASVGGGLFVPLVWGMLPDTVDYAHWKFGHRTEGIITATFVFLQKATSGIAGYISGIMLVAIGYIPNVVQSAETMKGISFLYNVAGALFAIVSLIFMFFYDLDDKKFKGIIEDLQKRANEK
jgi:sugar (Glycoside-Pentoside-Hexuronide) transporter